MHMEKRYLFAVAALVVAALLWFFLFHSTNISIKNYPSAGTDIIAFGDSLVAGVGAESGMDFVSLLSQKIGKPIINLGVPGETTEQGLARVGALDQYHPKVVLLLFGGNDYLRRLSQEETFANLSTVIEEIQSRGAIVLLLGVRGGVLSDHFRGPFDDLSKKYHTAYVPDVLAGLFGHADLMSDEVHPNSSGYARIAERIYPVLTPLLR